MEETPIYLHGKANVPLNEIVKEEYRNYQIYTLMDRAIPYLQDGLKPGQRRILYTLWKNQGKGLVKVSAATGMVLTLHPHGPVSIESAIVNMAQDYTFANNYPLIDKKGYFGERMEPTPAAGRYIECRLGDVAKILLFDDMNQVEMIPNFDETTVEPAALLPKLPLMLLNGAEGIGTGFSSVVPSFHHRDVVKSMTQYLENGKPRKLRPFVNHYNEKIGVDKGKYTFPMTIEEIDGGIYITELPRGFDSVKTYRYLGKFIENGFLKDFVDSTVNNDVKIELLFKRGQQPSLEEVQKKMGTYTAMTPNYTLISERGVRIFNKPEEIVEIFTEQRRAVVKRRYELLCDEYEKKIRQNNEIIKFIKNKEYEVATRSKNRKTFVQHLQGKKYHYHDYLADMPIYRMTKEEVNRRKLMVEEDTAKLKDFQKVAKSDALVQKKLVEELEDTSQRLDDWMKKKEDERKKILKKLEKNTKEKASRSKKTRRKNRQ